MLICSYNQFLVLLSFSISHFINVCSRDFSSLFLLVRILLLFQAVNLNSFKKKISFLSLILHT